MTCGVYEIWVGPYFYQGSSDNVERRIRQHRTCLEGDRHSNKKMQNVFNKYQSFEWQLLVECDKGLVQSYEDDYIQTNWGDDKYLNLKPSGYSGGSHRKGAKHTNETRELLSKAAKSQNWDNHKTAMQKWQQNRTPEMEIERRRKISETMKRRNLSRAQETTLTDTVSQTGGGGPKEPTSGGQS